MSHEQVNAVKNNVTINATFTSAVFVKPAHCKGVVLYAQVGTAGGTSPTLDCKLQGSFDGTNFHDIVSLAQLAASNAHDRKEVAVPLEIAYKVVGTLGGSASPNFTTSTVQIGFLS